MSTRGRDTIDAAWREAAEITYTEHVIHYGNDGPPETDRVLSAADRERLQVAIAFLVEQTGIAGGFLHGELLAAAEAYGDAPGTDTDPDYLGPPDWEELAGRWREHQIRIEARRDATALWGRLSNAPAPVQHQFWAESQSSPTISESTLMAAYQAVAERSGIELVTDPDRDDGGNPVLAEGQGIILGDGTVFWHGPPEHLCDLAATDGGEQCGPTPAVRRASAIFASPGAPVTTLRWAGATSAGPPPHSGRPMPHEIPRSGRTR